MSYSMVGHNGGPTLLDGAGLHPFFVDAQVAESFLLPQLTYIEREVYRIQYPGIRYPDILPVDFSGNPWTPSVTYFSIDGVGQASWFSARAQDVPLAEVVRSKYETPVSMASIGYQYDVEELAQAQMLGHNLTADKASYARLAAEKFIDTTALFGDTQKGFTGLFNATGITTGTAAATGTAGSTKWQDKTATQMLIDANSVLNGIWTATNTVELADTLLMPLATFTFANNTPFNTYSERTVLSYIRENNIYTSQTGRPLRIIPIRGLDTAGGGGTGRMIAYRRDPAIVKMHMPMPFRFLPENLHHPAPLVWQVPGIFRFGGTDVRRPGAFAYLDGTC